MKKEIKKLKLQVLWLLKVIRSCENQEQLETAREFATRVIRRDLGRTYSMSEALKIFEFKMTCHNSVSYTYNKKLKELSA
jgi:ribosomal protein L16/L10AE